jgi:hypothetical protein
VDVYEKIAAARWQREEPTLSPEALRQRRDAYWQHGQELTPEQLARHRQLRGAQVGAISKAEGVQPGTDLITQAMGPNMRNEEVHFPKDTGHFLRTKMEQKAVFDRQRSEPIPWRQLLTREGREDFFLRRTGFKLPKVQVPDSVPTDPSVEYAVLQHELGERAQARASLANGVGTRNVASHLGETPDVAERLPLFRDPEAGGLFDKMRQMDPGDAFIQRKMRQFGHTPNNPMPLGGRAHRALAHEVLERAPLNPQAQLGRALATNPLVRRTMEPTLQGTHVYQGALPQRQREFLGKAERLATKAAPIASTVAPSLYEKFRNPVKALFNSARTPTGSSEAFLRHLSAVR